MKLPPEGARWLVSLRGLACTALFAVTFVSHQLLGVLANALPLYAVGCVVAAYNLGFRRYQRSAHGNGNVEREMFAQILLDLSALTVLLYFADLCRNPFLMFFVFHMLIGGIYLRGRVPYVLALYATVLVGTTMFLEYRGWIPAFRLRFPGDAGNAAPSGLYLLGLFAAFVSTIWITIYFATIIRRYVDRAHAELRQKEKMLGIGQLVAGIAHQIANPLDGMQNCLRTIGEQVKNDRQLTEYVRLMTEALDRIERTAKRVQAFARPKGIELQSFDVSAAVEATLQVLGSNPAKNVKLVTEPHAVPRVQGDPYTLQEVLFNLCANAVAAMPGGGTLAIRWQPLGQYDEDQMGSVAVEVEDSGVGIPRAELESIFEPFYTTRAAEGGTGLGLGLCRMLIAEMGGQLTVRSVLGQGTVFTVILNPSPEASQRVPL